MSKVYFRHATMESGKSLLLLAVAHNYEGQGKKVICFKPKLDNRTEDISTRAGFSRKADFVLDQDDTSIVSYVQLMHKVDCVLVDEAQFFTREQVIAFTEVADKLNIPVIAYGLKSDFMAQQFEGTQAWIDWSDKIEEIKNVCVYCNSKALMNLRVLGNMPVFDGNQVEIGDTESSEEKLSYKSVCRKCYKKAQKGIVQIPSK